MERIVQNGNPSRWKLNLHALPQRSQLVPHDLEVWSGLWILGPALYQTIAHEMETVLQLVQRWSEIIQGKQSS